ncbi:MAG: hypothetical protein KAW12_22470 [Candidatus Aminicenantes bacterium]|nr:hypothetical protein [Candidatus Aminicenantes bacterium]
MSTGSIQPQPSTPAKHTPSASRPPPGKSREGNVLTALSGNYRKVAVSAAGYSFDIRCSIFDILHPPLAAKRLIGRVRRTPGGGKLAGREFRVIMDSPVGRTCGQAPALDKI